MTDIFTIYINIFGIRPHLMSLVFVITSLILGFIMLRDRYKLFDIILIELLINLLGTNIYETMLIIQYSFLGRGYVEITLYIAYILVLILALIIFNIKKKFININKWTYITAIILILSFVAMWITGLSYELVYNLTPTNDPHNWIWGVSKFFGFLFPLSILKKK